MISAQLREFGLPDYEARILAVLFARAPVGASAIAKQLGLSRSSVYTALAALTAKGLVSTTFRNEVKQFVPTGTEALAQRIAAERRELDARERIVADLRAHVATLERFDLHVPQVAFFEGVEGLKRIYLAMLREARPHATMLVLRDEFIWQDIWAFSWEEVWQERVRRWKAEKAITTKLLVNPSVLERRKGAFYRSRQGLAFRYLRPAHAVDRFALYVIGDTAALLSFETGNLIGIKIVNAHLARNMAAMFEALWAGAGAPRAARK